MWVSFAGLPGGKSSDSITPQTMKPTIVRQNHMAPIKMTHKQSVVFRLLGSLGPCQITKGTNVQYHA
jgi:hypothetical protein